MTFCWKLETEDTWTYRAIGSYDAILPAGGVLMIFSYYSQQDKMDLADDFLET